MKVRIFAAMVFAASLTVPGAMIAQDKKTEAKSDQKAAPKQATDPVCGMTVDPKNAPKTEYKGKTYYFCSVDEKKEFDQSPAKYIKDATGVSKDKK